MIKKKFMKKTVKGIVSLLLVLTVMVSLAAPFDIVKAIEDSTPATGSDIHAFLYYIDAQKKLSNGSIDTKNNLELIIQRGGEADAENRNVKTDFRYIKNINCTSTHQINGKQNGEGFVKDDHRNYSDYRLYTLVVTYEGKSASKKDESIDARAYIRYYDANGKLRVFYNNYNKTQYYGGCMCSFNQVAAMALPKQQESE